jgi:hypothetical protein
MSKSRGFRGLQHFFTRFHLFFMVFSRDFHAQVRRFSRVVKNRHVFYFFEQIEQQSNQATKGDGGGESQTRSRRAKPENDEHGWDG